MWTVKYLTKFYPLKTLALVEVKGIFFRSGEEDKLKLVVVKLYNFPLWNMKKYIFLNMSIQ